MPAGIVQSAAPFVPNDRTLPVLRKAVQHCRGCELYRNATQAVFGELKSKDNVKRPKVAIMMIGEQPGDQEDKRGRPFIGLAGKLLDKCLEEVEIDRCKVYVTNTVKHLRLEIEDNLRVHKRPSTRNVRACRPWLDAELEVVRPDLIVCLGSTAAQALLGSKFRVTKSHGEVQETENLPPIIATLHPSAILRARTVEDRKRDTGIFLDDLKRVSHFLKK